MNGITMDQWLKIVPDSVVNLPEGLRNLLFQLYQTFIAADRWKWFLNGLKITFAVTIDRGRLQQLLHLLHHSVCERASALTAGRAGARADGAAG